MNSEVGLIVINTGSTTYHVCFDMIMCTLLILSQVLKWTYQASITSILFINMGQRNRTNNIARKQPPNQPPQTELHIILNTLWETLLMIQRNVSLIPSFTKEGKTDKKCGNIFTSLSSRACTYRHTHMGRQLLRIYKIVTVETLSWVCAMYGNSCSWSTWEAEAKAEGFWVWGEPGLYSKTDSKVVLILIFYNANKVFL